MVVTCVYIGNLSRKATKKDLQAIFDFPDVETPLDFHIVATSNPSYDHTYGFLRYKSREAAETVLKKAQGIIFDSRKLRIALAKESTDPDHYRNHTAMRSYEYKKKSASDNKLQKQNEDALKKLVALKQGIQKYNDSVSTSRENCKSTGKLKMAEFFHDFSKLKPHLVLDLKDTDTGGSASSMYYNTINEQLKLEEMSKSYSRIKPLGHYLYDSKESGLKKEASSDFKAEQSYTAEPALPDLWVATSQQSSTECSQQPHVSVSGLSNPSDDKGDTGKKELYSPEVLGIPRIPAEGPQIIANFTPRATRRRIIRTERLSDDNSLLSSTQGLRTKGKQSSSPPPLIRI